MTDAADNKPKDRTASNNPKLDERMPWPDEYFEVQVPLSASPLKDAGKTGGRRHQTKTMPQRIEKKERK